MSARCGDHDGAGARHLGERMRGEMPPRGRSTMVRLPKVGAHADEGLKTAPQARFLSSCWAARRPTTSVARSLRHEVKGVRENKTGH
jgi:hypothetical protein